MDSHKISVFGLLGIPTEELQNYSVRLNGNLGAWSVLDGYYNHRDMLLEHAHKVQWNGGDRRNISTPFVLQFIQLREDSTEYWLFIGCSRIMPGEFSDNEGRGDKVANFQVLDQYKPFEARLIVRYKRKQGSSGAGALTLNLSTPSVCEHVVANMAVSQIAESPISAVPFPGYEQIRLTHAELVAAVRNNDWRSALNSISAVYLLTDRSNGWHYVGSAYSRKGDRKGLLSRWSEYAGGDHTGGNKGLKQYTTPQRIEENFQYSILEVFDSRASATDVIHREHWWMDTLQSVHKNVSPFGYNTVAEREKEA